MKLNYFVPLFIAIIVLVTSCNDEDQMTLLDEIQVSSSYVSIPQEGGSAKITVTAKGIWEAEKVFIWKNDSVVSDSIKWLTISSITGNAGESEVTFSAPATLDGRSTVVLIKCDGKTQRINIIQGLSQISEAKVEVVNAGPDGKTFRVKGVCTSIVNTQYGNWYLTDETGTLYIYGTLDAKGAERNFLSLGIEVGDEITVEGPKLTYNTTVELVNVTVINISKSLIKVESVEVDSLETNVIPLKGGEIAAFLSCKGQGVSVEIPEDAKSWLSISSIESKSTSAVVVFKAAANAGGDRNTTITFRTTDGLKDYTTQTSLSQKGSIIAATIAEFIAAEVSDTQYRLKGMISSITDGPRGRLYIRDFSGEVYVYGIEEVSNKGLKAGDIITIVGKRAAYNGPQVGGAILEEVISVTPITIAEVLTKPDSTTDYFMVTGEIVSIANVDFGNLTFKESESEIYVYGCYPGYGATGDFRKGLITEKGIKVGDKLTVIATKGSYQGTPQLANSIYFSHESAK